MLKHRALYYQGIAVISDAEFDQIENRLRLLDPGHPVLEMVGSTSISNGTSKVAHQTKMLSLDKTYVLSDLKRWACEQEIVGTFKIDGVSCSLIYIDGKLKLAKTRGDGQWGEDITSKCVWVENLPKRIEANDAIEVRGELYCNEQQFLELSDEMERLGIERPSSKRNIVAGILARKDNVELARYLQFSAFDILAPTLEISQEIEKKELLTEWQFETPRFQLLKTENDIENFIKSTEDFMLKGHFQIDGAVFTLNNLIRHQELGETSHHPRYKMAFKFQGITAETVIEKIEWSVSRNGILTPVAIVRPVELSSATISRVTLHNWGLVKSHNLKSGDKIEIIRSGEVIPKYLSTTLPSDRPFEAPSVCPSCGTPVLIEDIWCQCPNSNCPEKSKQQTLYYVEKIGIEDLSSKRLEEMIKKGLITQIPDLYKLSKDDFFKIEKVQEKLAEKLYKSIYNSKHPSLLNFLIALGPAGTGSTKLKKIIDSGYNTLEKILSLKSEDLKKIEGFADRSAQEFIDSLGQLRPLITSLRDVGIQVQDAELINIKNDKFAGKVFCITGSLSKKRSEVESFITDHGGKVTSAVSKKTHFLVSNLLDSSSEKFNQATELGIPIISEKQLEEMLK